MHKSITLAAIALAGISQAASFNFDSFASNTPIVSGTSFTDDGITLSIVSSGGWAHITDSAIAANQGVRSVFANADSVGAFNPFNAIDFRFDQDISHAVMQVGDGGGDNDGNVIVTLYDANDAVVDTLSQFIGTSGAGLTLDINSTFRRAVVDSTGTTLPHSVAAEFSLVEAVPEPITLLVLAPAALIAAKRRRKK